MFCLLSGILLSFLVFPPPPAPPCPAPRPPPPPPPRPLTLMIPSCVSVFVVVVVCFLCVCFFVGLYMSQHIDIRKKAEAALKCCYALHCYMSTIFSHDKHLAFMTASNLQKWRSVNPPKMPCGCPCGRVIKTKTKKLITRSSNPMECIVSEQG